MFGNIKSREKQLRRLEIVAIALVEMIGGDNKNENLKTIKDIIDKFAYDDNTVSPEHSQARDGIRLGGKIKK